MITNKKERPTAEILRAVRKAQRDAHEDLLKKLRRQEIDGPIQSVPDDWPIDQYAAPGIIHGDVLLGRERFEPRSPATVEKRTNTGVILPTCWNGAARV